MVLGAWGARSEPGAIPDEQVGPTDHRVGVRVSEDGADGRPGLGVTGEQRGRPFGLGEAVIFGEDDDRCGRLAYSARANLAGRAEWTDLHDLHPAELGQLAFVGFEHLARRRDEQ